MLLTPEEPQAPQVNTPPKYCKHPTLSVGTLTPWMALNRVAPCVPVTSPESEPENDVELVALPVTFPVTFPVSGPMNPVAVIVPLVLYLVRPVWAREQPGRLQVWLTKHNRVILMIVFGLMGALFTAQGVVNLMH